MVDVETALLEAAAEASGRSRCASGRRRSSRRRARSSSSPSSPRWSAPTRRSSIQWMPVVSNRATTVLVQGLVVTCSLWLGIRRRPSGRRAIALDVAVVLVALPLGLYLSSRTSAHDL
jgi:hypothetical protein